MKKAAVIIVCYLISIFISNFVVARELNVRWFDGVIPGGNIAHATLTCLPSRAGAAFPLEKDRTEQYIHEKVFEKTKTSTDKEWNRMKKKLHK